MNCIDEIKNYAQKNDIPIITEEGSRFICDYIQKHKVKTILEIGTAIGYSAIRFAKLSDDIYVTTIEIDIDNFIKARQNIKDNGLENRVEVIHDDALTLIIEKKFDLIFIDAAKAQYVKFFEKFKKNLNDGGVIISDNLSFHGLVEKENPSCSYGTKKLLRKIKRYIKFLKENTEYETEFFKLGDGISISKKKSNKRIIKNDL